MAGPGCRLGSTQTTFKPLRKKGKPAPIEIEAGQMQGLRKG